MKMKSLFFFAAAVFFAAPVVAEDQQPADVKAAIELPTYKVGDWWELKTGNGTTRRTVKDVAPGRIIITVTGSGAPYDMTFDDGMNILHGYGGRTGAPVSYTPHTRFLAFPMSVGTQWGGNVEWFSPPSYSGSYSVESKVVGWEKVRVGGAEYDALRIENNNSSYGKSTCWYAPAVKYRVKCTGKPATYEVTGFSVQ